MSNVLHRCDTCNASVYAPGDTFPPCYKNLPDDKCNMRQVEPTLIAGLSPKQKAEREERLKRDAAKKAARAKKTTTSKDS